MIVNRRHIHILEVVSVILFSVFGSYLVAVDPAFNQSISFVEACRLVAVLGSGVFLYFAVFLMRRLDEEAKADFYSESDLERKAAKSIDDRYAEYFISQRTRITARLFFALLLLLVFVFLEFLPHSTKDRFNFQIYGSESGTSNVRMVDDAIDQQGDKSEDSDQKGDKSEDSGG